MSWKTRLARCVVARRRSTIRVEDQGYDEAAAAAAAAAVAPPAELEACKSEQAKTIKELEACKSEQAKTIKELEACKSEQAKTIKEQAERICHRREASCRIHIPRV